MFHIVLLTGLIIIILVCIIYHKSFQESIIATNYILKLPGPPAKNRLVGNISLLFDTPENVFKVLRKWGTEYYPIYKNYLLFDVMAAVSIVNPYDFEIIMTDMKHNKKGQAYNVFHNWLGTGLLTSEGSKWQLRRKILTPSFHFNILQKFIKIFNKKTKNLIELLQKECDKPYVALTDYISDFTLNTIGETAMGTNFDSEIVNSREYKVAIYDIGKVYVYRMTHPWLMMQLLYVFVPQYFKERKLVKILHQFTNGVISQRQQSIKSIEQDEHKKFSYSKRKGLAMLDLLLTVKTEEGSIDDDGIREEVDTFMFEGHDTTSTAICFALMLLACHRDVQDRIYEEIQQVLPGSANPAYQTLQELKYTERCIKEVLRLYPSVHYIARVLGKNITTHNGYRLNAGSMVQLHIYDVHHNPDFYPDPEKFDPDRFLPENSQNRHTFAYVPFSAGPRNCIGQKFALLEIKAVLCGILSEFVLEPVDTPSTIELVADVVLRSKDSIKVKFVSRKKIDRNL